MSAKSEIERRLRKPSYQRIAKELFDKQFDDLNQTEYQKILKIADLYGQKYKKFYKLKTDRDIRTITSNLEELDYTPNYHPHANIEIIGISKTDTNFRIYTEFYTSEETWIEINRDGKRYKEPQNILYRRIMTLEYNNQNKLLIISIDPIGDGAKVYKKIDDFLAELSSLLHINFNDFYNQIKLEKAIFQLVNENKLSPSKVIAKDEAANRIKSVISKSAKDSIKDEDIYSNCENSDLKLENLRMKFKKESIELFGETLLKLSTRADHNETDELTRNIISIL